jgi:hypothetical protein
MRFMTTQPPESKPGFSASVRNNFRSEGYRNDRFWPFPTKSDVRPHVGCQGETGNGWRAAKSTRLTSRPREFHLRAPPQLRKSSPLGPDIDVSLSVIREFAAGELS